MNNKPELIVFSNFRIGGIKSYYENILSNAPSHDFEVKWIFLDNHKEIGNPPKPSSLPGFCATTVFDFLQEDTFYTAAKRLSQQISDKPGIILTNSDLELCTLSLYRRNNKTVCYVCHDELFVADAVKFEFVIDVFITHNYHFYEKLRSLMPSRTDDVKFIPHGVRITGTSRKPNVGNPLILLIISRLYESKGMQDIPLIDQGLKKQGVNVQWNIIGDGPEKQNLITYFSQNGEHAKFYTPETNKEVLEIAASSDVFVLPSRLDGLPVALLESMSVGCVPVISRFNEGIDRVVSPAEGYILPVGDNERFIQVISLLSAEREKLEVHSEKCKAKISNEYDITKRAKEYFELFNQYRELKKSPRHKFIVYGNSYLDMPFIPDFVRKFIRRVKKTVWQK